MSFLSVLQSIGKDFAKGLKFAVTYAVPAEKLVALLFPGTASGLSGVTCAITLIQNAVLLVEQKYAASGVQDGTGAQKLAEVVTADRGCGDESAVAKSGITVTPDYLEKLVSAVVAILNVQPAAAAGAAGK